MKKTITSKELESIEKLLGSKGVKKGEPLLTNALADKVKENKVN